VALDTPGPPAEAAPTAAAAEGPEPAEPGKRRKLLYVTLPGCWGALIFACLSFTPSLLPRGGVVQGLVWGITAAIGYGLGVVAAWVWRAFADRDPRRPRRWAWLTFFITGGVLLAVAFGLGQYWQYEIRKLMGVTDYNISLVVASPFVAALIFCLLLLIGRALHGLYRWLAKLLNRWIGRRAARAVGWVLVVGLTYVVVSGLLLQGFINLMNNAYSVRDTTTAEGVHQPTTSLRSGGPGSLVRWDTRAATSSARAPRSLTSRSSPTSRPWSRSGSTPGWHRPTGRRPRPRWPSTTSSAQAGSSARTWSW
jgi:uncharacterized membrane protein